MTQTAADTVTSSAKGMVVCAGCNVRISDRYLLSAVGKIWHEGCLKCSYCSGRLDELGLTLFVKDNAFFCRKDYLRYRVGERFFFCEKDGQILCEEDYRRRLIRLAASTAGGGEPSPPCYPSSVQSYHCSARSHQGSSSTPHVLPPTNSLTAPPRESWTDEYLASNSPP